MVEGVKKKGGLALKFVSPSFAGVPDRLILLEGGIAGFVELKSEGKKPNPQQVETIAALQQMGFSVEVIDNKKDLTEYLNSLPS